MVEQQQDDVDDVLLVDPHDLELGQEQLGDRDGRRVHLQAAGQRDDVAELEAVVEDIDVDVPRGIVEDRARALGADVDLAIVEVAHATIVRAMPFAWRR